MAQIIFRGVSIRYADLRLKEEAGVFARLHLSADDTDTVREAMDWEKMPDCVDSCKLSGAFMGKHFELIPNDRNLKQFGLTLDISEVEDFRLVPVKNEDGEITDRKLRFIVRSTQKGAIALAEEYLTRMGSHVGQLKLSYAKQEKLDLQPGKPADQQSNLPIPTEAPEEERRTAEEIEAVVPAAIKEPALASVREMKPRRGKDLQ